MRPVLPIAALLITSAGPVLAQDAAKVDAKHYKVEFENDQVRVLRVQYGPGEKSVMHEHAGQVAVFLTEANARFVTPDGKAEERSFKHGEAVWAEGGKHLPANIGSKPFELILVELKRKSASAE